MSIFDNSANKTTHTNPFDYAPSFWHDFHNMDQASGTLGGDVIGGAQEQTQGTMSFKEPGDTKMTAMTE